MRDLAPGATVPSAWSTERRPSTGLFLRDKMFGNRDREYRADDFSVRIVNGFRELVTVVHTRNGIRRELGGERIGKRWQGIGIHVDPDVGRQELPEIVHDLETAFAAMHYGYVISRTAAVDTVPESERQAAIAEFGEMGFDVEVSAERKRVSLVPKPDRVLPDKKQAQRIASRTPSLLQAVRGRRHRIEVLAISKDFDRDRELYIPQ
jgi:hypothetical protein